MQLHLVFHSFEQGVVVEREGQLIVMEHMKDNHFVLSQPELSQCFLHGRQVHEHVGEERDDSAGARLLRELREHFGNVRFVVAGGLFELVHQQLQMIRVRACRQHLANFGIERDEPDHVLLLLQHVGETRRAGGRIIVLRAVLTVVHRFTGIDDQGALEVRLLFVFLDVEPVSLGPDLPVDVPGIVAGRVFAVGGKFDGKAVVGRAVLPRDEAFHDKPSPHIEPLDAVERFGIEIGFSVRSSHGLGLLPAPNRTPALNPFLNRNLHLNLSPCNVV